MGLALVCMAWGMILLASVLKICFDPVLAAPLPRMEIPMFRILLLLPMIPMLMSPSLLSAKTIAPQQDFYVSPKGNDAWSGRLIEPNADGTDGPLATLAGAQKALRALKNGTAVNKEQAGTPAIQGTPAVQENKEHAGTPALQSAVTVWIADGTYELLEPLVFAPEDSGALDAEVTYAAMPGAHPVISGGRRIEGFRQEGKFWTVTLPEVKEGKWYFESLWVNEERRTQARIPNKGQYLRVAGNAPGTFDTQTGKEIGSHTAFRFKKGDIVPFENMDDARVVVMQIWDTSIHRIQSIDSGNGIVQLAGDGSEWPFPQWGPRLRYYITNVFEGLDEPGEWYLNRKTGKLYYMPMPGEKIGALEVVAPVVRQFALLEGDPANKKVVEWLNFKNMAFEYTDTSVPLQGYAGGQAGGNIPAAIEARGARACSWENCSFAHLGTFAIWLREGSRDNRIVRNFIHDLGAGGVKVGGDTETTTETHVMRNVVDNNIIYDGGHNYQGAVGVFVGRASYTTISHNDISEFTYSGISAGWDWLYDITCTHHNFFEYNHIHHIGRGIMSDMGGIYTLGVAPGSVVRNNLIHDVYSYSYGGWGIYHDASSSGFLTENNIVYNTKSGGFIQNQGKANRIRNNIFAWSDDVQIYQCPGGQLPKSETEPKDIPSNTPRSHFFERNIVLCNNGQIFFNSSEPQEWGWLTGRYWFDYNCYWDTSANLAAGDGNLFAGVSFQQWREHGMDLHGVVADPMFVDAKNYDFRLKPDSPALAMGFKPIDASEIGLYGDHKWVNAPKKMKHLPVEAMDVTNTGPQPLKDDFEDVAPGLAPQNATVSGVTKNSGIWVTDETAASGKQCVVFQDAPGLSASWEPHMAYMPRFKKGTAVVSFDLKLGRDAVFVSEWRDGASPYHVGPSLGIDAEGNVTSGGDWGRADGSRSAPLMKVPRDQWMRIEIRCPLGAEANGMYNLTISVRGGEAKKLEGLAMVKKDFKELQWLGFISNAVVSSKMYMDNLVIEVEKD